MAQLSPRAFETHSAHSFASAVQLDLFFKTKTGADFVDWFNQRLAGNGAFVDRRIRPDAEEDMLAVKREFAEFWDTIPVCVRQTRHFSF